MESELFRKKSSDKISPPDKLTDYISVCNPKIITVISALCFLIIGACAFGILGRIDTSISTAVISDGAKSVCYLSESVVSQVSPGDKVEAEDECCYVLSVSDEPVNTEDDSFSDVALELAGIKRGENAYIVLLDRPLQTGVFFAKIVTGSISPISFVLN